MSESIQFYEVCELLESLSTQTVLNVKKELFHKLVSKIILTHKEKYKQNQNVSTSIFHFIRLLVPKYDRERSSYGIKQNKLSKLLQKVFNLEASNALHIPGCDIGSIISKVSSAFPSLFLFLFILSKFLSIAGSTSPGSKWQRIDKWSERFPKRTIGPSKK